MGVYCSPLPYDWGRVRGCGCPLGGGCTPPGACVGMRAYMRACVHATCSRTNAQTCVRIRVCMHPRPRSGAFGCARASAPILYYPHPDYFSAIFLDPPLIWYQKRKPPITYGGFLSVEGECLRNFEQNRGPWKPSTLRLVQDCPCKRLVIHCSLGAMDYKLLFSTYFVSTV